jgi:hypothetical protein
MLTQKSLTRRLQPTPAKNAGAAEPGFVRLAGIEKSMNAQESLDKLVDDLYATFHRYADPGDSFCGYCYNQSYNALD